MPAPELVLNLQYEDAKKLRDKYTEELSKLNANPEPSVFKTVRIETVKKQIALLEKQISDYENYQQ